MIKQYQALMATEGLTLEFTECGISAIADMAAQVNSSVENIGARRLATIIEKVLEEISFDASDKDGQVIEINKEFVQTNLSELVDNADLSKFIL